MLFVGVNRFGRKRHKKTAIDSLVDGIQKRFGGFRIAEIIFEVLYDISQFISK
jgi:hypothetical protein